MPKQPFPPSDPQPHPEGPMPQRYSKAKAKDMTDPRRHGYKARGGPVERITVQRPVAPDEGLSKRGLDNTEDKD